MTLSKPITDKASQPSLIDVSAWLGLWPFQPLVPCGIDDVAQSLKNIGVTTAMITPMQAVLSPDPHEIGRRMTDDLASHSLLHLTPLIDPTRHDASAMLQWAIDQPSIAMVRFAPSYRLHQPDDPRVVALIKRAAESGLAVGIIWRMEDERAHYPLMKVPPPPIESALRLAHNIFPAPVLIHNLYRPEITELASAENLLFDLAMVDGADPIAMCIDAVGVDRLVFSSHAPLMHPHAQHAKLIAGVRDQQQHQAISHDNAMRLLQAIAK